MSFKVTIPYLLAGKVTLSGIYSKTSRSYDAKGEPTRFSIDLDFPALRLSKTLESSELHSLFRDVKDTLSNWRKRVLNVNIAVPALLVGEVQISDLYPNYNTEGEPTGFSIDLDFPALRLSKTLESSELYSLDLGALESNELYSLHFLHRKLEDTASDLGVLESSEHYSLRRKVEDILSNREKVENQPEDTPSAFGLFESGELSLLRREAEDTLSNWEKKYQHHLDTQHREHRSASVADMNRDAKEAIEALRGILAHTFEKEKQRNNNALEEIKSRYKNAEPKAVEEYCDLVLTSSNYPDYFPQNWLLEYRADVRMVVVDYDLPSPDQLPTVESYRYIKAHDEIAEKPLTEAARKKLYDSVIYQVCIRTLYELFEADTVGTVETVAFNGLVTSTNPATGIRETKTIISVSAAKDEFMAFDLSQVEPKATFKHLKGVAAATLVNLTPIPPVIKLDKTDKRFVESKEVAANLDGSINIAAMHWEDFEHLVRELFEKEFTSTGGEVKVTQASADGGVDAVAFDPDPIRGGKIVIQAKRYTNTVGVAAVRDLYGTVMNEGAIKGILVTTSDYGKDSYEFAKDKPLTLLNGSNLLALLEKHGHQARIDVAEAKKILNG